MNGKKLSRQMKLTTDFIGYRQNFVSNREKNKIYENMIKIIIINICEIISISVCISSFDLDLRPDVRYQPQTIQFFALIMQILSNQFIYILISLIGKYGSILCSRLSLATSNHPLHLTA